MSTSTAHPARKPAQISRRSMSLSTPVPPRD
jgi:hypothetical protein